MDDAGTVHMLQGLHDGSERADDLFHPPTAFRGDLVTQSRAVQIFHHDIGSIIGLEIVEDRDNGRFACKIVQYSGLFQKAFQIRPELGSLGRVQNADIASVCTGTGGFPSAEIPAKIFLDRHMVSVVDMQCLIGDAEPALADHAQDPVSFVQDRALRQSIPAAFSGAGSDLFPHNGIGLLHTGDYFVHFHRVHRLQKA